MTMLMMLSLWSCILSPTLTMQQKVKASCTHCIIGKQSGAPSSTELGALQILQWKRREYSTIDEILVEMWMHFSVVGALWTTTEALA